MNLETQIRQALARGYCHPENEKKVLDPDLIEAMTHEVLESFSPAKPCIAVDAGVPELEGTFI